MAFLGCIEFFESPYFRVQVQVAGQASAPCFCSSHCRQDGVGDKQTDGSDGDVHQVLHKALQLHIQQ